MCQLSRLHTLSVGNNNFRSLEALKDVAMLPCLTHLYSAGNPVALMMPSHYRASIVALVPTLKTLDGIQVGSAHVPPRSFFFFFFFPRPFDPFLM